MKQTERGSSLFVVLVLFLISGVIAAFILYRTESEWALVIGFEKGIALRQVAEAVLADQLMLLKHDETEADTDQDAWYSNGRLDFERNGCQVIMVIEDEGSKPNLNLLNDEGLQTALTSQISPDPILDWRDVDDESRPNGAENQYYQELNPSYESRNGFFASVKELRQLREGDQIYPQLASKVTVYGKVNPNTLRNRDVLVGLFLAHRFEKHWVDSAVDEYLNYFSTHPNGFSTFDDFHNLTYVTMLELDQLKRFMHFTGNCNINLMTLDTLATIFSHIASINSDEALTLAKQLGHQIPFTDLDELKAYLEAKKISRLTKAVVGDYFTTVTTIVRYKIWVTKGTQKFYLDTVQERTPGDVKGDWNVHPLTWQMLLNSQAPGVPPKPASKEE